MADATSTHKQTNAVIPIVITTPRGAKVTIEFGEAGQNALRSIASRGEDELAATCAYIESLFNGSLTPSVDLLEDLVRNLEQDSRDSSIGETVRLYRLLQEGLEQMLRFAEGPFSDPRIDGFGPVASDPIDRIVAEEAAKQVSEAMRQVASMAFNVSPQLPIEDHLEVPEADTVIRIGGGEPPRILGEETEVDIPSIYGDMGRYTERQPRSRAIGDIDRGLYGNRRRRPRRHSE